MTVLPSQAARAARAARVAAGPGPAEHPAGRAAGRVALLALSGILVLLPVLVGAGTLSIVKDTLVLCGAAMSLNLMFGYAGQLSLGHSAFFGVGAYTTGVLVSRYHWSPFATLPVAFVLAFVVGLLVALPALRIRGIYLGLTTLALALMFPDLMSWHELSWLTKGSAGLPGTGFDFTEHPRLRFFGWDAFGDLRSTANRTIFFYWLALGVAAVVLAVTAAVVCSRVGHALQALRDNEVAALAMGVDVALTKALVIGLSAGLCALPGSVAAIRTGTVVPDSTYITFAGAVIFLIAVIVGGTGTLWGPVVGAAAYVLITDRTSQWADASQIPAFLRPLLSWSSTAPGDGLFAVALILLMFLAPAGLAGLWQRAAQFLPGPGRSAGDDADHDGTSVGAAHVPGTHRGPEQLNRTGGDRT